MDQNLSMEPLITGFQNDASFGQAID
jgi:hypothetical protein